MEIAYKTFTKKSEFTKVMSDIIEHQLHNDVLFSGNYRLAAGVLPRDRGFDRLKIVSMAYYENKPVGICLRFKKPGMYWCTLSCFVKDEFRKTYVGSELVKLVITKKSFLRSSHQFPIGFPCWDKRAIENVKEEANNN